ncbi:diacylglycerol kinase 4-like protein [Tanacetum coccineum]|uniref:Diacylglycerol kinase 4-like protein n=1 Tax=Tanacetum coccineum TaxID=301880 RepID=A0ABQ5J0X9_9ASTR
MPILEFDTAEEPPSLLDVEVFDFDGPFGQAASLGHADIRFLRHTSEVLADMWVTLKGKLAQSLQSKLHLRIFLDNNNGVKTIKKLSYVILQVKLLLEMLVKKCGLEAVKEVMPEEHMKLLTNIRKTKEWKERKYATNTEETKSRLSKAATSSFLNTGMYAQVAYGFHHLRNEKPYLVQGPISNKGLKNNLRLHVKRLNSSEWELVPIPSSVRSIVSLNLHNYARRRNPWGQPKPDYMEKKGFVEANADDGIKTLLRTWARSGSGGFTFVGLQRRICLLAWMGWNADIEGRGLGELCTYDKMFSFKET